VSDESTEHPGIDPDRLARGAAVFDDVYAGVVPLPPPGFLEFADVMLTQLFAEQWTRPQLERRERRLITLAAVLALGETNAWAIHLESALRNDEITPTEAREILIHLAQYVGYPRVQGVVRTTEEIIGRVAADSPGDGRSTQRP
jgi:4-carboxymuconolactone decarboxylase